jgi:hypothetical protein
MYTILYMKNQQKKKKHVITDVGSVSEHVFTQFFCFLTDHESTAVSKSNLSKSSPSIDIRMQWFKVTFDIWLRRRVLILFIVENPRSQSAVPILVKPNRFVLIC